MTGIPEYVESGERIPYLDSFICAGGSDARTPRRPRERPDHAGVVPVGIQWRYGSSIPHLYGVIVATRSNVAAIGGPRNSPDVVGMTPVGKSIIPGECVPDQHLHIRTSRCDATTIRRPCDGIDRAGMPQKSIKVFPTGRNRIPYAYLMIVAPGSNMIPFRGPCQGINCVGMMGVGDKYRARNRRRRGRRSCRYCQAATAQPGDNAKCRAASNSQSDQPGQAKSNSATREMAFLFRWRRTWKIATFRIHERRSHGRGNYLFLSGRDGGRRSNSRTILNIGGGLARSSCRWRPGNGRK